MLRDNNLPKILGVTFIILVLSLNRVSAEPSLTLDSLKIGSQYLAIYGDEGRFREDNYITDDYTGGIEELLLSGTIEDTLLRFYGRAIHDYDYGFGLDLTKEDSYFFKLDHRQTRRYYDGSNEPFNPTPYRLPHDFADRDDGNMYIDRFDTDTVFGWKLDNFPDLTFGYTRWVRSGEQTTLRGEDLAATGLDTLRSYPGLVNVDGISDKVFVQLSDQIADKHNVSLKQQLEVYHDEQTIDTARYSNGTLSQFRQYNDEPHFHELLTHLNYNSFLTNKTYLTGNYLFQNLKNTTKRTELRTNLTGNNFNQFIEPDTNNRRNANVFNVGLVNLDNVIKDLRIGFNARFQESDTKMEGEGIKSGTRRLAEAEQSEYQFGQSFSVAYSGIKRTKLSYTLELEQRSLHWTEYADIGSYELVSNFGATATVIDRETNINHNDIINTLQLSTRLNKKTRLTAKYKHSDKRRKYENLRDNLPTFYPGYLGSSDEVNDKVTVSCNTNLTPKWSSGVQYAFEAGEIGYAIQGDQNGMELTRNSLSGSLTGILSDKFTLNFMAIGDLEDINTPGVGVSTNPTFSQGENAYDYRVERVTALVSGNYRLSDKTSTSLSYQHTDQMGTIKNSLDKFSISAIHHRKEDENIEALFEIYNFNEKTVGYNSSYSDFDDYFGIGLQLIYSKKF